MAIEDRVSTGIELPTPTQLKRVGSGIIRWVLLTAVVTVWVVFWGLVTRVHLQQDAMVSAAVVSLLFVLPMIFGYGYYLYARVSNL